MIQAGSEPAAKQAFIKMIRDEVTRPTGEEMNRAIRAIFPFDVARHTCWGGASLQPRFFVGRID